MYKKIENWKKWIILYRKDTKFVFKEDLFQNLEKIENILSRK